MSDYVSTAYLRPADVAKKLSIGVSTIWLRLKTDPRFPRPIKLGARTTLFSERELDEYLSQFVEKARGN